MLHDVFICHASEDKQNFVRSLAEALKLSHIEVWYDEFSLNVGDSLRQAIDRGLAESRFGIVVLSPNFFCKRWTQRELNGLVAREMTEGRELVLPIWHGIDVADIIKHSPPLADVSAIKSSIGLDHVVSSLLKKIRPEESPLIVARDMLISRGVVPPVISDEWWLDVVEFKEAHLRFPDLNMDHKWIFPLPFESPDHGKQRGSNIAWTALQMDWMEEGETEKYCQLTNPEKIHNYLRRWPGLMECSQENPEILALYAPQLTIPGYDDGFNEIFDRLLQLPYSQSLSFFGYSDPDTIDGKEPLCGEAIAWRHEKFGNYTDAELASSFISAHTHHYGRDVHSGFECLVWLLSSAADWLPSEIRSRLLNGLRVSSYDWVAKISPARGKSAFEHALFHKSRSKFRFTREIRADLENLIETALDHLKVTESAVKVTNRFIEADFVGGYFDEQKRLHEARTKNS